MGPPLLPLLRLCMVVVGYSTRYIFDSDLGCLAATLDSILCYFGFSPKREDCEEERQHKMCLKWTEAEKLETRAERFDMTPPH